MPIPRSYDDDISREFPECDPDIQPVDGTDPDEWTESQPPLYH